MKILALTHRFPWPPNRGTTIRSYHILKFLASQNEVALLSFEDSSKNFSVPSMAFHSDEEKPGEVAQWAGQPSPTTFCKRVEKAPLNYTLAKFKAARALLNGMSLSVKAFQSKSFHAYFEEMLRTFKPDSVFTDSSVLAYYPLKLRIPFIADFMDVDSEKWNQYAKFSKWPLNRIYAMESRRLSLFEKEVAEAAQNVLVVSREEESRLKVFASQAKVTVIPNGVDTEYFKPSDRKIIPGRVVFTGVMDYFPNIDGMCWFTHEVWPKIKQEVPHASFYIVGINPSYKVRQLSKLPGVVVTGRVPDVRPYLAEAQVAVAPLRFSLGLQNKVLEALAMGKTIIATPGAVQGIELAGVNIVQIAENADDFARNVINVLENPELSDACSQTGPDFIKEYYDWDKNLKRS